MCYPIPAAAGMIFSPPVSISFNRGVSVADHTFKQLIRYRFDSFMARGGSSIFISLVVVFIGLLLTIAVVRLGIYFALPGEHHASERKVDMFGQIYIIWLAMTDPGNMNQDVESHALYKVPAIMAGLAGIVILSMLIAFITTALDQKITQLKKGHSKVIESDHTLILGWGERITEILRELVIANESEDNPCVVILSEIDKEEMDDYLSVHMPDIAHPLTMPVVHVPYSTLDMPSRNLPVLLPTTAVYERQYVAGSPVHVVP